MTLIGHDFPIDALVAMDIGDARETGNDADPSTFRRPRLTS
ncbi:MAG: hypothetical protein ACLTSX_03030 [Collinsella sp.]